MKKVRLHLLIMPIIGILFSCSKVEKEAVTCEDTNTTKVTYSNTTTETLRVVVSTSLTPQFEPVDPIFTLDLAPGQSVLKEFQADKYINTWYNGCPSNCNLRTYNFKDYIQCNEYEEKQ